MLTLLVLKTQGRNSSQIRMKLQFQQGLLELKETTIDYIWKNQYAKVAKILQEKKSV